MWIDVYGDAILDIRSEVFDLDGELVSAGRKTPQHVTPHGVRARLEGITLPYVGETYLCTWNDSPRRVCDQTRSRTAIKLGRRQRSKGSDQYNKQSYRQPTLAA